MIISTNFTKIFFFSIVLLVVLVLLLFGYKDIPLIELKAKYGAPPSTFVSIDGMDVHYRDEGRLNDSIPIVLIHGTGSSLHTFEAWANELKKDYRVIRMDLPGYGLTGPFPDGDYSTDRYEDFIKSFLATTGIEKCIIGGNSLGGSIAWNFTANYPEMVDKLILIDASGYPYQSSSTPIAFKLAKIPIIKNMFTFLTPRFIIKQSVQNVYSDKSKVSDALIDRHFELSLREGNRQAFLDRFQVKNDINIAPKVRSITQKTLILWGEKDELIPIEKAYQFHEDLPNDTLVILKDVGHVPMEESPNESLKALLSFLRNK